MDALEAENRRLQAQLEIMDSLPLHEGAGRLRKMVERWWREARKQNYRRRDWAEAYEASEADITEAVELLRRVDPHEPSDIHISVFDDIHAFLKRMEDTDG